MGPSPGHQKFPDHHVREQRVGERLTASIGGEAVASSSDVIRVDEDGMPARHYFPRADVAMNRLDRTETVTECPFKGQASHFAVRLSTGESLRDAAWSYEDPYDEHRALQGRVAFYDEKRPGVRIQAG